MKSFISFLFILPAFLASLSAQEPEFKKPMTMEEAIHALSRPSLKPDMALPMNQAKGEVWVLDSILEFRGNVVNDTWDNDHRIYYTYDSLLNLSKSYQQLWFNNKNDWENTFLDLYKYDDQNRVIEDSGMIWHSSSISYKNFYKYLFTYTNDGLVKSQYELAWNSITGTWDSNFLLLFEYNNHGYITKSDLLKWNKNLNQWENFLKWENLYSDTSIYIYRYIWNNSSISWVPELFEGKIYNALGQQVKDIDQVWDIENQSYLNTYLTNYTYDNNGFLSQVLTSTWNNKWISEARRFYLNDGSGKPIQRLKQEWIPASQKWIDALITYYFYDDVDHEVERVTNKWNKVTNNWDKNFKSLNFYSKRGLVSSSKINSQNITDFIFPNPAHDLLNFNAAFIGANLRISNLQGAQLLNKKLSSEQVYIGDLPAGVYVATLKGENYTHTTKLIKL